MSGLPDYAEALSRALDRVPVLDDETVALDAAAGRVLREAITADRDLPPFDRAQMDGYAVRASEIGRVAAWPVAHTIAAGRAGDVTVPEGQCVAIATGAPVPAGLDTVVEHELTDRGDPVRLLDVDGVRAGRAIHPRGADARPGDVLVPAGVALRAHHLGIAAAAGRASLRVARRPRAVVLTTGDEVVPAGASPAPHQIRNSNGPQTIDLLRRIGAEPLRHEHAPDEREPTTAAVARGVAGADVLVTIGGVSAGERDHLPAAFEANGIALALRGAAIQPGKPVVVGRAPSGAVVVGLPGNPVSSLVCACLFVWPIVRSMLGLDPAPPWREAALGAPVRPNPRRRAFRPAAVGGDGRVTIPAWAGSGDLAHTAGTHGIAELPVQEAEVAAGTVLRFLEWP